jgi:hypothetical protein
VRLGESKVKASHVVPTSAYLGIVGTAKTWIDIEKIVVMKQINEFMGAYNRINSEIIAFAVVDLWRLAGHRKKVAARNSTY